MTVRLGYSRPWGPLYPHPTLRFWKKAGMELHNPKVPPVDWGGEEMGQLLLEQEGRLPNLQGQESPNSRSGWAHLTSNNFIPVGAGCREEVRHSSCSKGPNNYSVMSSVMGAQGAVRGQGRSNWLL